MTLLALIGISLLRRPPWDSSGFFGRASHPSDAFNYHLILNSIDLQDFTLATFVGPGDHLNFVIYAKFHRVELLKTM